jgi:hypothetical protein
VIGGSTKDDDDDEDEDEDEDDDDAFDMTEVSATSSISVSVSWFTFSNSEMKRMASRLAPSVTESSPLSRLLRTFLSTALAMSITIAKYSCMACDRLVPFKALYALHLA